MPFVQNGSPRPADERYLKTPAVREHDPVECVIVKGYSLCYTRQVQKEAKRLYDVPG